MAFSLNTKRQTMVVTVDGVDKELPLQPTSDEMAEYYRATGMNATFDSDGNMHLGEIGMEGVTGTSLWFRDYAARYLGDSVRDAGYEDLQALKEAWDAEREALLGATEGEASSSPRS